VGVDANALWITTNDFQLDGGNLAGTRITGINKAALMAGVNARFVTWEIRDTSGPYSFWPARVEAGSAADTANGGTQFFIGNSYDTTTDNANLYVFSATGTNLLAQANGMPTLQCTLVTSPRTWHDPPCYYYQEGQSVGDPNGVGNLDTRVQQVVYAGGKLFTALNTGIRNGNNYLGGIMYFVLTPSFKAGVLSVTLDAAQYLTVYNQNAVIPAITVDSKMQATIFFSVLGPQYDMSAAYAPLGTSYAVPKPIRITGIPPGPLVANTANRIGDFSTAVIDERGVAYGLAEIGGRAFAKSGNDNWAMWVTAVSPSNVYL
jgi:hypothetical protein